MEMRRAHNVRNIELNSPHKLTAQIAHRSIKTAEKSRIISSQQRARRGRWSDDAVKIDSLSEQMNKNNNNQRHLVIADPNAQEKHKFNFHSSNNLIASSIFIMNSMFLTVHFDTSQTTMIEYSHPSIKL